MFQEFYITQENGEEKDILNKGSVWCAYYVSNILKQFNLTPVGRANVDRIISDLEQKWWMHLESTTPAKHIPVWSILVRESHHWETYNKMHKHIGFYMWNEQAISNNSIHFTGMQDAWYVPVQHHYTYDWQRPLTTILTRDWSNPFANRLYHYELDIPCISSVWENNLREHWLSSDEIFFRSGQSDGLQDGRLCWVACVLMALSHLQWVRDDNTSTTKHTLKDCIQYADTKITYTNAQTGEEKTVSCFTKETWRYHSWLLFILEQLAKKDNATQTGILGDFTKESFLQLAQDVFKKNISGEKTVLIASVTPHFNTTKEKKWGHLVVVVWLDYNGFETSIIVCDPLWTAKKQLPLDVFLDSCSGKYIIIK